MNVILSPSRLERIEMLRQNMLVEPQVCVEKALYTTESFRSTEGAPIEYRRARALDHVLTHLTVGIGPGELFVGRPTVKLALGSILNMRIDPDAVKNDEKMDRMVSLLRTFCETGGNLVQFNFASNAVLRAAQKDPDQYRDLLVRVATYSAFFVELGPETQEDIINRNELE